VITKKGRTKHFSLSSLGAVVGSGIRDGSGSGIGDKHPGSATLGESIIFYYQYFREFEDEIADARTFV
jgi:hypothetical protein